MAKVLEEDINTNTDIVTVEAEDVVEESPLLVAQRYLNIFRQIHIFKASKKAEFDNELLNLPEKIKRILINLPGGRILLEHILELEEKNNYDASFTKLLIAQKKKQDSSDALLPTSQQTTGGVSGELKIGSDFANVLARSLATALGNNTIPQPFNASGLPSVSTSADGKQINTQNNAAATTVNNINVDYSVFKNLADAINKSNSQTHDDFMKVVDALNQNFNPTIVKTDGIPLSAITSSLTQVLKENSRQQLEEMKMFSKTLTDAILGKSDTAQPTEKNDMSKTSGFNMEPTHIAKQNITQRSASGVQNNSKTQTISVTNKSVNPLTSQ
ncbi:MAG: hypothetical protein IKO06_04850, partial [Alphaproteobacteria bacterium]|nr:hypothetical protein [Alphaproteobacteria bacterium]